jgi:hypothetical protein
MLAHNNQRKNRRFELGSSFDTLIDKNQRKSSKMINDSSTIINYKN